ncbi:MAG TPA: flavoprotein, partial [Isosphaeraceae bacterium]
MSHIILGVTGSVAAVRTPAVYAALLAQGHRVRVVATEPAL